VRHFLSFHNFLSLSGDRLDSHANFANNNSWIYLEGRKKMKSLKKAIVIIGMSVFSLFFLCSAGRGQGFKLGFKFTGGLNYQLLGDGDAFLRGRKAQTDDYMNAVGSNYTLEQSIIPFVAHFGYEFDADAILYFTPQFGLSLGTGYVRGGTLFGSGNLSITSSSTKETDLNDVAASAVPIKIGIYYTFSSVFVPQGKSSSYLFAGIGIYSANYSHSENYTYQTNWENYSEKGKASGIGFYAGFGGEKWINPNFAFIYEISGRYANIGGFTGNWQDNVNGIMSSGSGNLYYYEWLDSRYGNWYPWTNIYTHAPSGSDFRNVREAKIDFSGVGIKFGIKINL
jgi:hypothetical protein